MQVLRGRSTGVHLHYTVIKADSKEYIEPMEFFETSASLHGCFAHGTGSAAMRANLKKMPKPAEKPEDSDSEDLPDGDESG